MALTKVKLIADGVITSANLDASHGITTSDIGEGSNLYYTDSRVSSYLSTNGFATQTDIVAAITDSAPSTLDTLNELAAALGDDANFSTTVTNSIATKMPLAGGIFTGNVQFNDNIQLNFGSGADFKIKHNGSNAFLENYTGGLYIDQNKDDGSIIFRNDDGSGGVTSYMEIRGGTEDILFNKNATFQGSITSGAITSSASVIASGNSNSFGNTTVGALTASSITSSGSLSISGNSNSIGTTTFTGNVTTSGNINAGSSNYLRFTAAASGSDASVLFGNTAGTGGSLTFKRNSDASTILRLDADGNVGIGTASPSATLHVQTAGSIKLFNDNTYGYISIGSSGLTGQYPYLRVDSFRSDGSGYFWAFGHETPSGVKSIKMLINDNGSDEVTIIRSLAISTFTSNEFNSSYPSFSTGALIRSNDTSYFNGGNVGIGTTTPDGKLEVAGGTTLGLRITNAGDSSAYDQTRITYSGYNSGNPEMVFMPLTTPGSGVLNTFFRFRNTNGSSTTSNNTANVSVDGNVGIGTDSPSTALHIDQASNDRAGGLYIERNGSSYGLAAFVNSGGYGIIGGGGSYANDVISIDFNNAYVGIGTTSPSHKLQIDNGSMLIEKDQQSGGTDHNFIQLVYNGGWSANVNGLAAINVTDGYPSNQTVGKFGITYDGSQGKFVLTNLYNGGYGASGDVFTVRANGEATFGGNITIPGGHTIKNDGNNDFEISSTTNEELLLLAGGGMHLRTNGNTERLTILQGGNVGIGTTSPQANLDVNTDLRVNRYHKNVFSYYTVASASNQYFHIKTGVGTNQVCMHMYHVEGYAYGTNAIVDERFGFHTDSGGSIYGKSYKGTYANNIYKSSDNKVVLVFGPLNTYYMSFMVHLIESGMYSELFVKPTAATYSSSNSGAY